MKIHRIGDIRLGSGVAIGLVVMALIPSPSLAAQKHDQHRGNHLSGVHRSSNGFGRALVPAQELSPEAARMKEAQKIWPNRPLCDDGGYRITPCDLGGGMRGR